ncbi:methionyl-tRNA formyltransferase [Chitinivorax tropicus]|uniref:Methionyl-tRNA formyltransferase n=2 Tax=Chitinivorax tropicus TaxID=714531 RepID=A0A840MNK8_9PROT|nr:methionyl-tRNA formyltransferase [Chitinivorax tropicus]
MARAVVFAYHNVGVRCLSVLLARGVEVALVVTHEDNPNETIWFDSVAELAALHGIPVIKPADPNTDAVLERVKAARADWLFSFYYRHMLKAPLLATASQGAYNMHGSLLPKYRGRVPVNWAIIHGETETGATLHVMNEKPDNGAIVDQTAVPILPDDTAHEVFNKVTVAAELTLYRCLPALLAGTATLTQQDLAQGAYFGGRKAEDGRIDWHSSARQIHNLVRAVAPPYPGAHTIIHGLPARILQTQVTDLHAQDRPEKCLYTEHSKIFAKCGDGSILRIVELELAGHALDATGFVQRFGTSPLSLA